MKFTLTLDLPEFETNPQSLPAVLHKLARELEGDVEPEAHPMDDSLPVKDHQGNTVGWLEVDFD